MFKLPRKSKKKFKKDCGQHLNKENWEWFYFRKRVEVRCMEVILTYPEYDKDNGTYNFNPKLAVSATNEELLEYYTKYYPNDKLALHYCKQNRHKWDKFNTNI